MFGNYSWQDYMLLKESKMTYEESLDTVISYYYDFWSDKVEVILDRYLLEKSTRLYMDVHGFYTLAHDKTEKEFLLKYICIHEDYTSVKAVNKTEIRLKDIHENSIKIILPANSKVTVRCSRNGFYIMLSQEQLDELEIHNTEWIPETDEENLWSSETNQLDIKFEYQIDPDIKGLQPVFVLAQDSYVNFLTNLCFEDTSWTFIKSWFSETQLNVTNVALNFLRRKKEQSMANHSQMLGAIQLLGKMFNLKKFMKQLIKHMGENQSIKQYDLHIKPVLKKYLASLKTLAMHDISDSGEH